MEHEPQPDPDESLSAPPPPVMTQQQWNTAVETCYRENWKRFVNFADSFVRDHEEAEAAVQEACVRALNKIPEGMQPSGVKPWFYTVIRNLCMDEFRRRDKYPEVPHSTQLDDDGERGSPFTNLVDQHPFSDPARIAETREFLQTILNCSRITQKQREVLELVWLAGHEKSDAARILDIDHTAVRDRIRSARPAILECLRIYRSGHR